MGAGFTKRGRGRPGKPHKEHSGIDLTRLKSTMNPYFNEKACIASAP